MKKGRRYRQTEREKQDNTRRGIRKEEVCEDAEGTSLTKAEGTY